jgi:hypothetical protein
VIKASSSGAAELFIMGEPRSGANRADKGDELISVAEEIARF